jgi:RNA polymerase sigma-70 factor (ECF subfamily)
MALGREAHWVDADWLASLLDRQGAALELFAAQWSDSPEDCVQEAFIQLVQLPAPPDNVAAWLFHVVKQRAISTHRAASRRRRHEALASRLILESAEDVFGGGLSNAPSGQSVAADFDAEELAAALNELDDECREVVLARIWGALGFAEIAASMGLSTSTVFRRFETGLKTLKELLEGSCLTKRTH